MISLWTIPLLMITFIGLKIQESYSRSIAYISVGILSFLIFGMTEQTMWILQSWYLQNMHMTGHLVLYIIIPEIILRILTYFSFKSIQETNNLLKIPIAFIIMIIYLGNAIFFSFFLKRFYYHNF